MISAKASSPLWLAVLALVPVTTLSWAGQAAKVGEERPILFYLHGRIVEEQGPNAVSEVFGSYEYEQILEALGKRGHEVVSEVREKNTDPAAYAEKVARQIRDLRSRGIPSSRITVVGASMGAGIAVLVSHVVQDPEVNYVLLAICGEQVLESWEENEICPSGNVLSIYEASDPTAGSCESLFSRCRGGKLGRTEEITLHLGNRHGMVYRPFEEWVEPALAWSER